mmetsp:Transcript_3717/g.13201  ORF Transcript_3717/g.13201 Transcript_3717/m.13201 type:complete len:332 (-) Transcript_3717:495-1490(-)
MAVASTLGRIGRERRSRRALKFGSDGSVDLRRDRPRRCGQGALPARGPRDAAERLHAAHARRQKGFAPLARARERHRPRLLHVQTRLPSRLHHERTSYPGESAAVARGSGEQSSTTTHEKSVRHQSLEHAPASVRQQNLSPCTRRPLLLERYSRSRPLRVLLPGARAWLALHPRLRRRDTRSRCQRSRVDVHLREVRVGWQQDGEHRLPFRERFERRERRSRTRRHRLAHGVEAAQPSGARQRQSLQMRFPRLYARAGGGGAGGGVRPARRFPQERRGGLSLARHNLLPSDKHSHHLLHQRKLKDGSISLSHWSLFSRVSRMRETTSRERA